ncbi:MAG: hypothetical protein ACK5LR_08670 [Mangrovibacterium sp.]
MKKHTILLAILALCATTTFAQNKSLSERKFLWQLEGTMFNPVLNEDNTSYSESNFIVNYVASEKIRLKFMMGDVYYHFEENQLKRYEDYLTAGIGLGYIIPTPNDKSEYFSDYIELVCRGGVLSPYAEDNNTINYYADIIAKSHYKHAYIFLGFNNVFRDSDYLIGLTFGLGYTL